MSFKTWERNEDIVVIDCPQRLDVNVSDELKMILTGLIESEKYKIIINLSETQYVDSSGLGAIVSRIAVTRANQGDVKLVTQTQTILDLLALTHLNKILKCFNDLESAVGSF